MDVEAAMAAIAPVLADVKNGSEETLKEFGLKFDGIKPESIRVPKELLKKALQELDPDVKIALHFTACDVWYHHPISQNNCLHLMG